MAQGNKKSVLNLLQEFSIPLIAGVVCALAFANIDEHKYHAVVDFGPLDGICANRAPGGFCYLPHGDEVEGSDASHADAPATGDSGTGDRGTAADGSDAAELARTGAANDGVGPSHSDDDEAHGTIKPVFAFFGHHLTLHFIVNDIFMLFFFGIATKEITESILPGGALNPPSKAVNPLLGTIGGVVGPIGVYFLLTSMLFGGAPADVRAEVMGGWGIPTATDIALAWLVARLVFGSLHPAVNFLLLLAIADDAIGLGIIAIFYPNELHPVAPAWLALVGVGMGVAWALRKRGVMRWWPYILIGGLISWLGLLKASLHPALALVPIVPFLPGPDHDSGFFNPDEEESGDETRADAAGLSVAHEDSPLHDFEHDLKLFVDFGLFFFGLFNAGVAFSSVNNVTWVVLGALVIGKTLGVTTFSWIGNRLGFKYPNGMGTRHIVVAGMIAAMGLTVALFVAGEAFPGSNPFQGPAKMGALMSGGAAILALIFGKVFRVKQLDA